MDYTRLFPFTSVSPIFLAVKSPENHGFTIKSQEIHGFNKKNQEFPGLDFFWFHRKHHGKHHQNPWFHSVFHGSALPSSRGNRCPPLPPCWPPPSVPTGPGRRWNTPRRATDGAHPKWKTWKANYGPLKFCKNTFWLYIEHSHRKSPWFAYGYDEWYATWIAMFFQLPSGYD